MNRKRLTHTAQHHAGAFPSAGKTGPPRYIGGCPRKMLDTLSEVNIGAMVLGAMQSMQIK